MMTRVTTIFDPAIEAAASTRSGVVEVDLRDGQRLVRPPTIAIAAAPIGVHPPGAARQVH
jgi:hypothetical protein